VRGVGEGTDIVDKEMYSFQDKGGENLTLRPEYTAGIMRAYLEHNMHLRPQPVKLFAIGPIFRYERPQKGRYRQAQQWGVECFGVDGPEADVEIIALGLEVMRASDVTDYRLELNSIGCEICRPRYRDALVAFLQTRADQLSADSRARLATNPMRIVDSKNDQDIAALAHAPAMRDFLCEACRAHFDAVLELLDALGIHKTINPRIVRLTSFQTATSSLSSVSDPLAK